MAGEAAPERLDYAAVGAKSVDRRMAGEAAPQRLDHAAVGAKSADRRMAGEAAPERLDYAAVGAKSADRRMAGQRLDYVAVRARSVDRWMGGEVVAKSFYKPLPGPIGAAKPQREEGLREELTAEVAHGRRVWRPGTARAAPIGAAPVRASPCPAASPLDGKGGAGEVDGGHVRVWRSYYR
uniref:Uncharacterized protein n=1 Tax=Alexandrium monilatum TaxID=311494 RepID=A0A7S4UD04_9DINO